MIASRWLFVVAFSYAVVDNVAVAQRSDPANGAVVYRALDGIDLAEINRDLMIYGSGTEIPAGKDGRWHRERLHLSPFIYRLQADGARQWNADYREHGHYYDPLCGDKVVRFGKMEPAED